VTDGPPDVRDSLSELEQRLLELERQLRADATSDAGISRQRAPVPRPPLPEPVAVTPQPPSPPARNPGGVSPEPGSGAGGGGRGDSGREHRPEPDLAPLVHETQRRVDSLRDTLDGLTGASDRLREVAQVMVEDHGRALVRLERATRQGDRPPQYAPEPAAAAREPAREGRARPAPETAVPIPDETREALVAFERAREAARARVPVAEPPPEVSVETDEPAPPPPPDVADAARRPPGTGGRRRWLWWVLAPLLVAAGLATALLIFGGEDEAPGPGTTPGASSRIALDVNLGRARDAFESVPGTRPASDIGPEADLCDGVVGAAVVLRTSADRPLPRCNGLVTIADGTVSARALAARSGSGGRPCVNADQASSIAATRRNRRLTAARQRAVQRAIRGARRETLGAGLTASERVATIAEAAYDAGRRFDARRNLRLYAVRERVGTECVVPGRDDVASGRYPLATRIELVTRPGNARLPAVQRAAVAIDNITSRPAPIDATVLRGSR
jgi:hypothetical protein